MKDETAYLQPVQEPAAGPAVPPAPPDPTIVHLPLYRRGTLVQYQGQTCTVGHVVVHRCDLQVHLQELGISVDATRVQLAPTRLVLQRS